jgi:ubiquinone/menaquinone biosynthesis C-methylase UbiE
MGLYRDHVFPRVMNRACNTKETRRIRAAVCAPLAGEVLELGFGTGLNLAHLPATVTRLLAVDPLQKGRELAADRLAATPVEVDFVGLDGQSLELDDDSVDAALSTWTLCTIPDATAAVREVGRVLRPGGTFHFAEHGRAPDHRVRVWQDRLNGVQRRVACGCNLNRDIAAVIAAGGMTVTGLETFYAKGDPKIFGWIYQGTATADAPRDQAR